MTATTRRTIMAWLIVFGVLLVLGSGLVADLSGSFADSDRQFDEIHGAQSGRLRFIVGGALLALAALTALPIIITLLALVPFSEWRVSHVCALAFTVLFSALLITSAASYATVSASRELGDVFDDTGQFQTGAWVLPQLATVLFVCASAAASALIIAVSASLKATSGRGAALRAGGGAAALLLLFSLAIPPIIALLPLWLLVAVLVCDEYGAPW